MTGNYRLWTDPEVVANFQAFDIPYHAEQAAVLLRLLPFERDQPLRVLDVGCGSGTLLEVLLKVFPHATGVGVDLSQPMLDLALEQLAPFGDRGRLLQIDLAAPDWSRPLSGPFDVIVSRYAIHHVPDTSKRAVYAACFSLLRAPGVFINIEHVASASPYLESLFEHEYVDRSYSLAQQRGDAVSYDEVAARFFDRPDKAANILLPVEPQLGWLRELGFADVDCYWKSFELAIFGGFRR